MNLSYFLAVIVLGLSAASVEAGTTNSPIQTIPEGITTYTLTSVRKGSFGSFYLSAPLANDPIYTGAVSSVSTSGTLPDTVSVGDSPAPWTPNQFVESPANAAPTTVPYYLKFLSGNEAGRVLQVKSNGTNSLVLDITDNSIQSVSLSATGFAVAAGDTFEVFEGDTLGSMFGLNTANSPLILNPGTEATADTVSIFSPSLDRFVTYYFSNATSPGNWVQVGGTGNYNDAAIRPYQGFIVTRIGGTNGAPQLTFTLTGRVAEVPRLIKATSGVIILDSTGFAIDTPLSELSLGTNWVTAPVPTPPQTPTPGAADTVSVWNSTLLRYNTYYQLANSNWCQVGGGTNILNSYVIPAGTSVVFSKQSVKPGATSFLQSQLPYDLNATNSAGN